SLLTTYPFTLTAPLATDSISRPSISRSTLPTTLIFFFNDTATTEIYTLSLHDALPICGQRPHGDAERQVCEPLAELRVERLAYRSEEHTSELQSRGHLVCRLLLEKKKKKNMELVK